MRIPVVPDILVRVAAIVLLSVPLAGLAAEQETASAVKAKPVEALTLDQAIDIAVAGNPGLGRVDAHARALSEVPAQAGTLPDPTLSFNALNLPVDSFALGQEAMTQLQVGVSQAVPFPGKLGLREQAAGQAAEAAAFNVQGTRLTLIRKVRISWWNLFFLDRALSVVRRNQELLREFNRIAETRYKTGQGMQSDVLLAQVELSKLLESEISLQGARRGQAAALNALLGRAAGSPVALPQQANETLPIVPTFGSLHNMALANAPQLASRRAELEAAHTRMQLAEKDYYPDFRLGAAYGFRRGNNPNGSARPDFASVMVSMNLPLFTGTKQDRAVAQRQAEVQREEYALEDELDQLDAEIGQALSEYLADYDQAALFKTGIIPQARQTAASMLAAYQVDKVDFLNLIRAQVTLYNYETQYWKTLSSGWQAWARLEAAVGTALPGGGDSGAAEENNHE